MILKENIFIFSIFILSIIISLPVHADAQKTAGEITAEKILKDNEDKTIYGPAIIDLGDQATMSIQHGEAYIPAEIVKKALSAAGNKNLDEILGMIVPGIPGDEPPKDNWGTAVVFFKKIGYVKDTDANKWNHKKILENINKSIEARNKKNKELGRPMIEPAIWVDSPTYNPVTHHMRWSILEEKKGSPDSSLVLYTAVALGREGILMFGYGVPKTEYESRKPHAQAMLESIKFKNGKNYSDFNHKTDKVSDFELSSLIGGLSGKELGILALALALLAKFAKPLAIVIVAISSIKLFRKKKEEK